MDFASLSTFEISHSKQNYMRNGFLKLKKRQELVHSINENNRPQFVCPNGSILSHGRISQSDDFNIALITY